MGVEGWALKSRHKVWVRGPEPQLLPVGGGQDCPIQLPGRYVWLSLASSLIFFFLSCPIIPSLAPAERKMTPLPRDFPKAFPQMAISDQF